MAGWQPKVCECGHTEGDHMSAGAVGALRIARAGLCKRCDCRQFADQTLVRAGCDQLDEEGLKS